MAAAASDSALYADSTFAKVKYPLAEQYAASDYKNILDDSLCDIMAHDTAYARSHAMTDTRIALSAVACVGCGASVYFAFLSPLGYAESWNLVAAGLAVYAVSAVAGLLHALLVEKSTVYCGSSRRSKLRISSEFSHLSGAHYTVTLSLTPMATTSAAAARVSLKRCVDVGEYFTAGKRGSLLMEKWYETVQLWRHEIESELVTKTKMTTKTTKSSSSSSSSSSKRK